MAFRQIANLDWDLANLDRDLANSWNSIHEQGGVNGVLRRIGSISAIRDEIKTNANDNKYAFPASSLKIRKPDPTKMSTSGSIRSIPIHAGDTESRTAVQISRMRQEYDKRLLQYERDFDVSLSRFAMREKAVKESMLAYTARMRNNENSRSLQDKNGLSSDSDHLFVRAQHIPKMPISKTRRRRPASLDELTGKLKDKDDNKKNPPSSAPGISLPSLPERLTKGATHHVKISFVSASDLYDIVDFSLRNKGTKAETLKFLQMEAANKQKHSENDRIKDIEHYKGTRKEPEVKKNNFLPPVQGEQKHNEVSDRKDDSVISADISKLPLLESLQIRRPNRAKRMKLRSSGLGVIPENDAMSVDLGARKNRRMISPPPKMSPRVLLGAKTYLATFNETDANNNNKIWKSSREAEEGTPKTGNRVKGNKNIHIKAKQKAHKQFKNLIFLRDIPERKSRI